MPQDQQNPEEQATMRLSEAVGSNPSPAFSTRAPASQPDLQDPNEADDQDASGLGQKVAGAVGSTAKAVVRGVGDAVDETASFVGGIFGADDLRVFGEDRLPERQEGIPGMIGAVAQFAAGMAGAGKIMAPIRLGTRGAAAARALGGGRKARKAARAVSTYGVAGAASDAFAFDPYEQRLSTLLAESDYPVATEIGRFLQADEDTPEAVARMQAALEGAMLGLVTLGTLKALGKGIQIAKLGRGAKEGKIDPDKAVAEARRLIQREDPVDLDALRVHYAEDGSVGVRVSPKIKGDLKPDEIRIIEEMQFRDAAEAEVWAASRNLLHKRMGSGRPIDLTDKEMADLHSRINTRINQGVDPKSPEIAQEISDNLGLLIRSNDDYRRVAKSLYEAGERKQWWVVNRTKAGGKRTDEEVHREALEIFQRHRGPNATVDDMERFFIDTFGDLNNLDAKMHAMNMINIAQGQDVARLARLADRFPENKAFALALDDATRTFASIHMHNTGSQAWIGRAQRIQRYKGQEPEAVKGKPLAETRPVERTFDRGELKELARDLRWTRGNPELILKAIRHRVDTREMSRDAGWLEKMIGFRVNMMLSGPTTHAINSVNNAITSWQVPMEYWWAGMRTGNRELAQQGRDMLPTMETIGDAFKLARRAWKEGQNPMDPGRSIDEGVARVNDMDFMQMFGHGARLAVTAPGRALMTADTFFKQMNYRSHVRAQALRMAREDAAAQGLRGNELKEFLSKRVNERIQNAYEWSGNAPGKGLQGAAKNPFALHHARYTTFQNDLNYGAGAWLQRGASEMPAIRIVLPFIRTPVNLVRFAWQRTPGLNRWQRQWSEDLAAGGERAAFAKARTDVGSVIWGSGMMAAVGGMITGSGPSNPALRQQWREAGNQPYSIRLPDGKMISYRRIEPLASAVGIIADFGEALGELDEGEDVANVATAGVAALASSASSKTFLIGLSDFFSAVADGNTWEVDRVMKNFAQSFHPNFVRQLNTDPVYRETRTLVDQIRARTPWASTTLEPRRNLFGDPILKPPMMYGQDMNPFTVMVPHENAEVRQALVDLGKALPMPPKRLFDGNLDLTDRQAFDNGTGQSPYDRRAEIVSELGLEDRLTRLVQSDRWDRMGAGNAFFRGGQRYEIASAMVQQHYDRAWKQVLREYPKLRDEVQAWEGVRTHSRGSASRMERDSHILPD